MVTIPAETFHRMTRALLRIEKHLDRQEDDRNEWVSEEQALHLLGCKRNKLYELKGTHINYKAVGRRHQYDRRSIDRYNKMASTIS